MMKFEPRWRRWTRLWNRLVSHFRSSRLNETSRLNQVRAEQKDVERKIEMYRLLLHARQGRRYHSGGHI